MVFGNERNFVVALVTLDPDALAEWAKENDVGGELRRSRQSAAVREMIEGYVEELNRRSTAGRPSRSGSSSTTTCPSSPVSSPPR